MSRCIWVWWVLTSTGGFAIGGTVMSAVGNPVDALVDATVLVDATLDVFMVAALGIAMGGILAAVLQWPALRRHVPQASRWVAVSVAAGAVVVAMHLAAAVVYDLIVGDPEGWALLGAWIWSVVTMGGVSFVLSGTVFGALQWTVLRRGLARSGRWVLGSTVGWVVSWGVVVFFTSGAVAVDWAVFGASYGAITGSLLLRLPSHPETTALPVEWLPFHRHSGIMCRHLRFRSLF